MPHFKSGLKWFLDKRPDLAALVSRWHKPGSKSRRLLSLARAFRMKKILHDMLDENEFLSPYGIRALSRYHLEHPYIVDIHGRITKCTTILRNRPPASTAATRTGAGRSGCR